MTPETTQLGLLKTLAAQDEEIKTLRAQVAQYKEDAERYLEALIEMRDRIKEHPAYADLTVQEECDEGGDTAEFSYLVRVACAAIDKARKA